MNVPFINRVLSNFRVIPLSVIGMGFSFSAAHDAVAEDSRKDRKATITSPTVLARTPLSKEERITRNYELVQRWYDAYANLVKLGYADGWKAEDWEKGALVCVVRKIDQKNEGTRFSDGESSWECSPIDEPQDWKDSNRAEYLAVLETLPDAKGVVLPNAICNEEGCAFQSFFGGHDKEGNYYECNEAYFMRTNQYGRIVRWEGGARRMMEEGLFRLFPCDAIYALHNWPALPLGTCVARDTAMMAATAVFEIVINGRGCHGAMPHQGIDPIVATCQLVSALQSLVSRNADPLRAAVVSVTQIHAGDAYNVIPDSCVIRGTTRWFDDDIADQIERRIAELSRSIAEAFGCQAQISYKRLFPATINDPAAASLVRKVTGSAPVTLTVMDADPSMGAEDFAFMLQAVPGCYLWLGGGNAMGKTPGLHSPQYDFNDQLLSIGAQLWVSLVRHHLAP